jgi:hypothetical protein
MRPTHCTSDRADRIDTAVSDIPTSPGIALSLPDVLVLRVRLIRRLTHVLTLRRRQIKEAELGKTIEERLSELPALNAARYAAIRLHIPSATAATPGIPHSMSFFGARLRPKLLGSL